MNRNLIYDPPPIILSNHSTLVCMTFSSIFGSVGPWAWRGHHQHAHGDALLLQRVVQLVALRDRHAQVAFAVLDERRRRGAFDVEHRRMLAVDVEVVPELR